MANNLPVTPGSGAAIVAAIADGSGNLHQQVTAEFLDGGGLPSSVTKLNPFPVSNRNQATPASISTANNTAVAIAAAPAALSGIDYFNNSDTETVFLKLYNLAAPTSANTPVAVFQVLPYTPFNKVFTEPLAFSTAIGVRVTTGAANNDTTSPTGSNVGNAFYRLT